MIKQINLQPGRILAVVGKTLAHSKSPLMQNAAIRALGLEDEYSYIKLEVEEEDLKDLCGKLKIGVITGANITIPYKTSIIPHLDRMTPEARTIGAVNTLYLSDERLIGDNTDARGFRLALEENNLDVSDKEILILGYGGSAKAIAISLISMGARKIDVYGRDRVKALEFIRLLETDIPLRYLSPLDLRENNYSVIVNCTPLGMAGKNEKETPLELNFLRPYNQVVDLIYNPQKTLLLKAAEGAGCKILNGLEMLVNQGALSLQIWTGKTPDRALMKEAILGG